MSTLTIQQAFDLAIGHHVAGRLVEAEPLYRQILAVQPQHAEAWHMLGAIALESARYDLAIQWIGQSLALVEQNPAAHSNIGEAYRLAGRLDEAVASYQRALALKAEYPEANYNLGVALAALGRQDEALAAFDRAIALKPEYADAHLYRGNALRHLGRLDDAFASYHRALELKPDSPHAHNNLGVALSETGRPGEAIAAFHRALELQPNSAEFHNNLGNAFTASGRFDDAIPCYRRALAIKPAYAEAHSNLGNALRETGQVAEAITAYRRALEMTPQNAGMHNNLANALRDCGQFDEAIASYRRALELNPRLIEAQCNFGAVLLDQGSLDDAVPVLRRALEIDPDYAEAHNNLGNVFKDQGRLDEAIAAYRRALELNPTGTKCRSNILLLLLCDPAQDQARMIEEQRLWDRQFSAPLARFIQPHNNDRDPERPLRIGYIAPAFGQHVVGRNLVPLFRHHDLRNFEIVCYAEVTRPDELTEEFQKRAPLWRWTVGLADDAFAALVRQDRVDILVDLALHTRGNRLPVFGHCPAPVQVSFAGYPGSAGVDAIPYHLSDAWLERGMPNAECRMPKEGIAGSGAFLLDSFWCYDPCGIDLAVNELPANNGAPVTFGSLNNFCKINDVTLKLWARVLTQVPGSQLLLLGHRGSHRQRTIDVLTREGVEPHRVEFSEWLPRREYLELYRRVDIVLDPFPYGGHTTSLDALWMGVPVVSLVGATIVSRAGLSILSNLGLPELVAFTEEDYVRIAAGLAHDLPRLGELRRTLRPRLESSVLMDGARFARNIEAAYRALWRRWCAAGGAC